MSDTAQLYALDIIRGGVHRIDIETGEVEDLITGIDEAPDGIVVDEAEGFVYFTLMGVPDTPLTPDREPPFTHRNGSIQRVPMTGGEAEIVVPRGTFTTGKQLATDPATGRLYWTDREGHGVYRSERDGSGVTPLVLTAHRGLPLDEEECVGIAVDAENGWLYWTQKGPSDGGKGRILRAALEIPDGETAVTRDDIEVLWERLPEPIDLDLDRENQVLYWTDRGNPPEGNTLNRAPIPAPDARGEQPTIVASGFGEAIGLALDLPGQVAYVSDLSGSIRAVDLRSGAVRLIAALAGGATGIALAR
jgi:hypothetical protein